MKRLGIAALALLIVLGYAPKSSATYTQQVALAQDTVFQGQVLVAMIQSCANTMTEAISVTGHLLRTQFCAQVLQNPTRWQQVYSYVLASQSNNPMTPLTVPSTVADSLVQTASDAQLLNISGYAKQ